LSVRQGQGATFTLLAIRPVPQPRSTIVASTAPDIIDGPDGPEEPLGDILARIEDGPPG
jgi:hypothetical protein